MDPARGVFLVADGMGGHAAGEVASDLAASTVERRLAEALDRGSGGEELLAELGEAFANAKVAISECCRGDPRTRGMGTTLTACVLDADGALRIGHIGDSRLYRMRGSELSRLTRDHTWVQREVEAGRLQEEAAANHPLSHILTRVLSADREPELDVITDRAEPGDLLLLATDGLYNMVEEERLASILEGESSIGPLPKALIDAANRSGGADNVTVVLVRILDAS